MDTSQTCAHIWKKIYNPNSMVPDIEVGRVLDILIETVEREYTSIKNPVARNILARLIVKGGESYKSIISSIEIEIEVTDDDGDFDMFEARCAAEKKKRTEALEELEKKGLIKNIEDVYSAV